MRVLFVDDDPVLLQAYTFVFGRMDLDVELAESIEEALDVLEARPVDVLVCDYDLGAGRRGTWLLEIAARRWPATRRLMITGLVPNHDQLDAWSRLVERVLLKPWNPDEVVAAIVDPCDA